MKSSNSSPLKASKLSAQQFARRNLIHGGGSSSNSNPDKIESIESQSNRAQAGISQSSSHPFSTSDSTATFNPASTSRNHNQSNLATSPQDPDPNETSINSNSSSISQLEPSKSNLSLSTLEYNLDHDRSNSSDLDLLEDSVRQSETIDDFTRIIQDFRLERRRRNRLSTYTIDDNQSIEVGASNRSSFHSQRSNGSEDLEDSIVSNGTGGRSNYLSSSNVSRGKRRSVDENSLNTIASNPRDSGIVRCTCCCDKDDCERKERAIREWRDMELDLRLAAGEYQRSIDWFSL